MILDEDGSLPNVASTVSLMTNYQIRRFSFLLEVLLVGIDFKVDWPVLTG